ncbi:MAG: hypothetical protein LBS49_11585 [Candidatus Accumulibacter sp.]|jgi:hypothetical protein|nr:hypothetical protein [Accumulibacter sp.]
MKPPALRISRPAKSFFAALSAALVLGLLSGPAAFAQPSPPAAAPAEDLADPRTAYKEIDLKKLVADAHTDIPGQRVIFAPVAVRFKAVLAAMPAPQKTDYLKKALGLMGIDKLGSINQRIGLDYGGEKALAAYIDDGAAARLDKEARPGQPLLFYAFHVYNHSRGPALVVTSFSPPSESPKSP